MTDNEKKGAFEALGKLRGLVSALRADAMFDDDGVSEKLNACDTGNSVSSCHYLLALAQLESAMHNLRLAQLTLGE